LQVVFTLGVLIIAALSGLCCLSLLNGPTKFEVPKEAPVSQ
jgi:hypothetical protein